MKLTNNNNLPIELVNAIDLTPHNEPNHYSATTLINGVREIILTERYYDKIETDASDHINTLLGTAIHKLFEGENSEKPYTYTISPLATLTGRVDYYNPDTEELKDYKTTTIYKVLHKDYEEWRKQLLIYVWLLRKNKLWVRKMSIIALIKDWSKSEYIRYTDLGTYYPPSPIIEIPLEYRESDLVEIEDYIKTKIATIISSYNLSDNKLPMCSSDERWETPTQYAIISKKGARAKRVFNTKEEADKFLIENPNYNLEVRPGRSIKCEHYCPVSKWCKKKL